MGSADLADLKMSVFVDGTNYEYIYIRILGPL